MEDDKQLRTTIKRIYNQILSSRVSLMGKFVKVGELLDEIEKKKIYKRERMEKELFALFYDGIIDLVPGKAEYKIEDECGDKFAYVLWREKTIKETFEDCNELLK